MKSGKLIYCALILGMLFCCRAYADEFAPHYPDYDSMVSEVTKLAENYPNLVDIEAYGKSAEGRDLMAIHIYRKDGTTRPAAMVAGNIHGNEMIGNRMALAVAHRLVEGESNDPWIKGLLDKMDFWILPCINPDGFFKTVELYKKGDFSGHRKNANEVDLNRNFLLPYPRTMKIEWAGSPKKDSDNYYGSYPLSEPETQGVKAFMDHHPVFASINYHSVEGVLFPARCTTAQRNCTDMHHEMGNEFIKHQKKVKYIYILWPNWLDDFTGEMEDMQYQFYGTLAIDIELGRQGRNKEAAKKELGGKTGPAKTVVSEFWAFNPVNIDFWTDNDRDATLYALDEAFKLTGGKPIPREKRLISTSRSSSTSTPSSTSTKSPSSRGGGQHQGRNQHP
jgi:hypothetical protein